MKAMIASSVFNTQISYLEKREKHLAERFSIPANRADKTDHLGFCGP